MRNWEMRARKGRLERENGVVLWSVVSCEVGLVDVGDSMGRVKVRGVLPSDGAVRSEGE